MVHVWGRSGTSKTKSVEGRDLIKRSAFEGNMMGRCGEKGQRKGSVPKKVLNRPVPCNFVTSQQAKTMLGFRLVDAPCEVCKGEHAYLCFLVIFVSVVFFVLPAIITLFIGDGFFFDEVIKCPSEHDHAGFSYPWIQSPISQSLALLSAIACFYTMWRLNHRNKPTEAHKKYIRASVYSILTSSFLRACQFFPIFPYNNYHGASRAFNVSQRFLGHIGHAASCLTTVMITFPIASRLPFEAMKHTIPWIISIWTLSTLCAIAMAIINEFSKVFDDNICKEKEFFLGIIFYAIFVLSLLTDLILCSYATIR